MYSADLHMHSTLSDGSGTIESLLDDAVRAGLTHVSLTDHDTTEGVPLAMRLGKERGITVIAGVEFSGYDYTGNIRAHILGYGMKDFAPVDRLGTALLARRHENSLRQIKILHKLGYCIPVEAVAARAGRHIYKQHIMHEMVARGLAESIGGATFLSLFKNHGPCAFDIDYLHAEDAIDAVKSAGGFAVLAHPGQQGNFGSIGRLVMAGLDGLEMEHHANSPEDRARIQDCARRYGLLLTGGSDAHGLYENNSPRVGEYRCPETTIHKMKGLGIW